MELTIDGITKSCCGGRLGWRKSVLEEIAPDPSKGKCEMCRDLVLERLRVARSEARSEAPREGKFPSFVPELEECLETLAFLHDFEIHGFSQLGKTLKDRGRRYALFRSESVSGRPRGIVFIDKYKHTFELFTSQE